MGSLYLWVSVWLRLSGQMWGTLGDTKHGGPRSLVRMTSAFCRLTAVAPKTNSSSSSFWIKHSKGTLTAEHKDPWPNYSALIASFANPAWARGAPSVETIPNVCAWKPFAKCSGNITKHIQCQKWKVASRRWASPLKMRSESLIQQTASLPLSPCAACLHPSSASPLPPIPPFQFFLRACLIGVLFRWAVHNPFLKFK